MGRRKFGTVSGGIVQALGKTKGDLSVKETCHEVERLLGERVSIHSVKGYLHRGSSYGWTPIFERVGHRRYRLPSELRD